jgi:hypothetical protein
MMGRFFLLQRHRRPSARARTGQRPGCMPRLARSSSTAWRNSSGVIPYLDKTVCINPPTGSQRPSRSEPRLETARGFDFFGKDETRVDVHSSLSFTDEAPRRDSESSHWKVCCTKFGFTGFFSVAVAAIGLRLSCSNQCGVSWDPSLGPTLQESQRSGHVWSRRRKNREFQKIGWGRGDQGQGGKNPGHLADRMFGFPTQSSRTIDSRRRPT